MTTEATPTTSGFRTFEVVEGSGYTGTTLVETDEDERAERITLVLQRRRNLHAAGFGENEWIEVDRFRDIQVQSLSIASGDGPDEIQAALENISSRERRHPCTGGHLTHPGSGQAPFHSMSVADTNKHRANEVWHNDFGDMPYPFWQPHFDRDFSSVMELLSVPLYGYRSSEAENEFVADQIHGVVSGGGVVRNLVIGNAMTELGTAQSRFLRPGLGLGEGNRWYRLLNFVQVDRNPDILTDPTIPDAGTQWWELSRNNLHRRHPGRLNPNTLRHEHVLAAWVDDSIHHDYVSGPYSDRTPTRDSLNFGDIATDPPIVNPRHPEFVPQADWTVRWWIHELLLARDGRNNNLPLNSPPGLGGTSRQPPGTHRANPFRPLNHIDMVNPNSSGQQTVLRTHASLRDQNGSGQLLIRAELDDDTPRLGARLERLGLFESRPSSDVTLNPSDIRDSIDYHTRHRILAKVANNSTTRSHVFAIWAGFTLHEAHRLPNGNVQIGARAEDLPVFRKFLVVDMSRLEEALDASVNPPRFDFRKFIIHQQRLP